MNKTELARHKKESSILTALLALESYLDGYNTKISIYGSSFGQRHRYIRVEIREAMNNCCTSFEINLANKTLSGLAKEIGQHLASRERTAPYFFKRLTGLNAYYAEQLAPLIHPKTHN